MQLLPKCKPKSSRLFNEQNDRPTNWYPIQQINFVLAARWLSKILIALLAHKSWSKTNQSTVQEIDPSERSGMESKHP